MTCSRMAFLKMLGMGSMAWAVAPPSLPALAAGGGGALPEARAQAARLRIRDVEIYPYELKMKEPFTVAFETFDRSKGVLIRIRTDAGLTGLGEASPLLRVTGDTQATAVHAARQIRDVLIGRDPLAIERALTLIGVHLHSNPAIVAAFDMALWDLLGKAAGLPVFRLLGGDATPFETDLTIGLESPEAMAASARAAMAQGFRTLKVKLGQEPAADLARLQAIREAVGAAATLRIDANQGYTVPQARYALQHMERFDLQCCEQPLDQKDLEGMRYLRSVSPVPLMADESLFSPADALRLLREEACDFFNIKLMKCGGITNALKIAWIAEAGGVPCMVGCMLESRLGLTAAAHVHGARRGVTMADLDSHFDFSVDPILGGIQVAEGLVTLPGQPGLGADLDPAFLRQLERVR